MVPDAHDIEGFDDMRFGIAIARKAWLGREEVLNCKETEEMDAWLKARKKG